MILLSNQIEIALLPIIIGLVDYFEIKFYPLQK